MENILLVPTFIIILINTSKLNKIASQNERTEDGTALLLPSPSAVLGRGKGRGHINIYLYGSVPSSVHLIIKPKWDTISWSWRLQRPPVWFFLAPKEKYIPISMFPYFCLILYPLLRFFQVSGIFKSFHCYFYSKAN